MSTKKPSDGPLNVRRSAGPYALRSTSKHDMDLVSVWMRSVLYQVYGEFQGETYAQRVPAQTALYAYALLASVAGEC
jgi:hypothetical protein